MGSKPSFYIGNQLIYIYIYIYAALYAHHAGWPLQITCVVTESVQRMTGFTSNRWPICRVQRVSCRAPMCCMNITAIQFDKLYIIYIIYPCSPTIHQHVKKIKIFFLKKNMDFLPDTSVAGVSSQLRNLSVTPQAFRTFKEDKACSSKPTTKLPAWPMYEKRESQKKNGRAEGRRSSWQLLHSSSWDEAVI